MSLDLEDNTLASRGIRRGSIHRDLHRNQRILGPRTAKRALDLVVAVLRSFAYPAADAALIVASIAIKLTSPGPVFFLQERIGSEQAPLQNLQIPDDGSERRDADGATGEAQ